MQMTHFPVINLSISAMTKAFGMVFALQVTIVFAMQSLLKIVPTLESSKQSQHIQCSLGRLFFHAYMLPHALERTLRHA